jgi:hypothetical protein
LTSSSTHIKATGQRKIPLYVDLKGRKRKEMDLTPRRTWVLEIYRTLPMVVINQDASLKSKPRRINWLNNYLPLRKKIEVLMAINVNITGFSDVRSHSLVERYSTRLVSGTRGWVTARTSVAGDTWPLQEPTAHISYLLVHMRHHAPTLKPLLFSYFFKLVI